MLKKIDLHIHTTMSDGALTPKEVIDKSIITEIIKVKNLTNLFINFSKNFLFIIS